MENDRILYLSKYGITTTRKEEKKELIHTYNHKLRRIMLYKKK